jgi:NADH-quinone oxidoreductase subunit J
MDLSTGIVHGIATGLAVLVIAGALLVVTIRNLFRAALSLGVVLLGVAGLFILLEAEFLAFVQVLVYVGAILTLVVFVVMLTAGSTHASAAPANRQRLPAALASLGLFALLASATQALVPEAVAPQAVSLTQLGQELITTLVLPFEVISLVFVAALVGAIALAFSAAPTPFSSPKKPS